MHVFYYNAVFAESGTPSGLNFTGLACLEGVLVFECSVIGGVLTVWSGTAFNYNCESTNNEIALLHNRFNASNLYSCNEDAVVGQVIHVEHNQYTSQLNITINNCSTLIGKNITCTHDNGVSANMVGYYTLSSNDFACSNYSHCHDSGESDTGMARVHAFYNCNWQSAAIIIVYFFLLEQAMAMIL